MASVFRFHDKVKTPMQIGSANNTMLLFPVEERLVEDAKLKLFQTVSQSLELSAPFPGTPKCF